MRFEYDDGGRQDAGFKGKTGDCVTRAISIATGKPYLEIYKALSDGCKNDKKCKKRSARNGVPTKHEWFKAYMNSLGWEWTPTMEIGSGCKVHLDGDELPPGRLIVRVTKHYCAVIDGVLHDTRDCSRGGTRCVYGYWSKN